MDATSRRLTWSRRDVLTWTAIAAAISSCDRRESQRGSQSTKVAQTPADPLVPTDDGACRHLSGMTLPDLELASTARRQVNLAKVSASRLVVYCYPLTSQPGTPQPRGWDEIAGARGCTAEARDFSARHAEFTTLGVALFGLSTQTTAYQSEMVARLQVPFEVLSDEHLSFARALRLPTFTADGTTFIKRLTLVVRAQRIDHVFYPVFPPETHAQEVLAWLKSTTA